MRPYGDLLTMGWWHSLARGLGSLEALATAWLGYVVHDHSSDCYSSNCFSSSVLLQRLSTEIVTPAASFTWLSAQFGEG